MANTKYSDFLSFILPELPGCSGPLAESTIRSTVIELCRRAKVWVVEADPALTAPGTATYDVDMVPGAALVEIQSMQYGGRDLVPALQGGAASVTGEPETYRQLTPEAFTLWPTPSSAGTLSVTMAIAPSRTSSGFPEWIAEKYHDAIVNGSKARLMLMSGNNWSNPNQGAFYLQSFNAEVANATLDAIRSFTRTTMRTLSQH